MVSCTYLSSLDTFNSDILGARLNAPSLAAGYSSLLRSVRLENSLPADLRELLVSDLRLASAGETAHLACKILRVAVLNNAAYEW